MPKKYLVANHRLRQGPDYVQPAEDTGGLYGLSSKPNMVVVQLNGESIQFLCDGSIKVLRRHCRCADCGSAIPPKFHECLCQQQKRQARVAELEGVLSRHANDRAALNSSLKLFFGSRTSERQARIFLQRQKEIRQRFGGPYEIRAKSYWTVVSWLNIDEKYRQDYVRTQSRKKRVAAGGGSHSAADIRALLLIQSHQCYFCMSQLQDESGSFKFSKDHLQPVSRGGSDNAINLALACKRCNSSKHMKTESEFWKYLKRWRDGDQYTAARAKAKTITATRKQAFSDKKQPNHATSTAAAA